jgi:predicted transcriptional regulator
MSEIDRVLAFILDKDWLYLTEISIAIEIDMDKLQKIVKMLAEFGFVQQKKRQVRICGDVRELLRSVSESRR